MSSPMFKIFLTVILIAIVDILLLSPTFVGLTIGASAFSTAAGVTILLASAWVVWSVTNRALALPATKPLIKNLQSLEDFERALQAYAGIKTFEGELSLAEAQLGRWQKKQSAFLDLLAQRFQPQELSYAKFSATIQQVESFFYQNIRNVLNRLQVFDAADFEQAQQYAARFSSDIVEKRQGMLQEQKNAVTQSLNHNEEILLKVDELMLEIAKLDTTDTDLNDMACMKEIDALIRQTKLYK